MYENSIDVSVFIYFFITKVILKLKMYKYWVYFGFLSMNKKSQDGFKIE